ncbi:long-chain fatty acid transport protein 3 isoform X1 [Hyperolius riggenbachi]|uniref:long-chain fatty acid transport protein 3 isoform X1 n=1 Tax=Hyperolius riggenbachi TaxID=752182 RepID=UPI0035A29BC3
MWAEPEAGPERTMLLAVLAAVLALLLAVLVVLGSPVHRRAVLLLHDVVFTVRVWRVKRRLLRWMRDGAVSLPGLFQLQLRSRPDVPFLLFREKRVTYRQLESSSNRAASALSPHTSPGDTLALLLANEPRFLTAWFALAKLGVTCAFLNTNIRRGALLHCLRACGARGLLTSPELFDVAVQEILPDLQEMGLTVWVMGAGDYPDDVINLQAQMDEASDSPPPAHLGVPKNPTDTAICIFTSGTTGLPKAARISHLKTLMCCVFYQLCGGRSDDVIYMSLPLYHKSGALLGIGGCLGIGATLVLKERFSASQFWNDCRKYNVTVFQYIGELVRYLTNQPQTDSEPHKVRMAAGSGLRPDVWKEFTRRFGNLKIFETYGMTEFNISFFNYTGTPGAVGRGTYLYKKFCSFELIRFNTLEGEPIRDSQGRCQITKTGETGLLISPVTTVSPFPGYVGNRELSEKKLLRDVFRKGDCYFNTGDLMVQDNLGFVHFQDRTGDTFRWKGENVATTEVSEIMSVLEFFQEVNIYGVSVPGYEGRTGMAAITLRPGHQLDLDQVFAHVMEFLPPYARPRFLRVLEHMETTGTFRQQKQRLVQDGFSPLTISDPLYVLDESVRSYHLLTEDLYNKILSSEFRV